MGPIRNLVIVGAGPLGREVCTWAGQCIQAGQDYRLKGFLDDRPDALSGKRCELPILSTVESYEPAADDTFVCAIGEPRYRRKYCAIIEAKGGMFTTLIHPSAVVGPTVSIGAGSIICPLSQLSCDISVGTHVLFGTLSTAAHDVTIGDFVQICGSCEIDGGADIGEGAFLGSRATILPGARVGAWSFVGAGSLVLRRVAPRTKVFGVPAVPVGDMEE